MGLTRTPRTSKVIFMQGSNKTSPLRTYGANQEWGRKLRKAESRNRRAASRREWRRAEGLRD